MSKNLTDSHLEETPAVLSLGKLCEDHGYAYHWTSGQKTHLTKKNKRLDCNVSNSVPFVVPGLSTSSCTSTTVGSRWYVGPLFHRFEPQSFLRRCFSLDFGAFFGMSTKSILWKTHVCFYHKWSKSLWMDTCAFTHEHPRTRRCTIHPRTLTTTLTINTTNHCISVHIWISLASVCIFFRASVDALYGIFVGQQRNGSWQLLVVAGLGDSGERRVVGQVGGFHRQWPWVAKQQRSSTCCGNQARRPVATLCRWEPTVFDARALGRDPPVHRGGTWATFSENRVKSLHSVSYLASVGDPHRPHLEDRHVRDRRKFAEEMLGRLALASGRRISRKISSSPRLNLNVICFSDEKIFRVDALLHVAVFTHFLGEKWADVTTRPPFSRYTMRKGRRSHCYVGQLLSDTSLRGRVYLSMDTPRRDVAWPPSLTRFVAKRQHFVGFERDSRCIVLVILSCLSTCHEMCHRITWLTLATNCTWHVIIPSMHRTSRSSHPPWLKCHVLASPQHVAT